MQLFKLLSLCVLFIVVLQTQNRPLVTNTKDKHKRACARAVIPTAFFVCFASSCFANTKQATNYKHKRQTQKSVHPCSYSNTNLGTTDSNTQSTRTQNKDNHCIELARDHPFAFFVYFVSSSAKMKNENTNTSNDKHLMDSSLITTSFAYVFRQEMDRNGADTKRRRTHFTVSVLTQ